VSDATDSLIGVPVVAPGPRRPIGIVVLSTAAALVAGASVSIQTSINGHVSVLVGSPVLATAVNHGSALIAGFIVALSIGSFPRAWRSLRANRAQLRWWWWFGGLLGFAGVFTVILAAPAVGLVTIAVAITLGQLAGSVIADSGGLGPGGRRRLTPLRLAGIGVALVATVIGGLGHFESGNPWLIPLIVAAGVLIAFQQAGNGWLIVVTGGEWATMTIINFVVSGLAVGTALVIQVAIAPPDFSAIPWWGPIGGILGASLGVVIATTVRTIGVLTSMLCVAAGQSIASVLADAFVPIGDATLTIGSLVGAALAILAVALAGLGSVRRTPRGGRDAV
jgi:transporter family-2 protein